MYTPCTLARGPTHGSLLHTYIVESTCTCNRLCVVQPSNMILFLLSIQAMLYDTNIPKTSQVIRNYLFCQTK